MRVWLLTLAMLALFVAMLMAGSWVVRSITHTPLPQRVTQTAH